MAAARTRARILIACLAMAALPASADTPAPGAWGFDWLKPDSAKCLALTPAMLKAFAACERRAEGSFGLSDPVLACRKRARSEWLVYASRTACQRNLDTMRANAP
jgi:hypothetical protein